MKRRRKRLSRPEPRSPKETAFKLSPLVGSQYALTEAVILLIISRVDHSRHSDNALANPHTAHVSPRRRPQYTMTTCRTNPCVSTPIEKQRSARRQQTPGRQKRSKPSTQSYPARKPQPGGCICSAGGRGAWHGCCIANRHSTHPQARYDSGQDYGRIATPPRLAG